jgi:hypothetical protein
MDGKRREKKFGITCKPDDPEVASFDRFDRNVARNKQFKYAALAAACDLFVAAPPELQQALIAKDYDKARRNLPKRFDLLDPAEANDLVDGLPGGSQEPPTSRREGGGER